MVATAQNGTLQWVGTSGRSYSISFYNPDVSGSAITFATTKAGASSSNFWNAPETIILKDASIITGIADTTIAVINVNDVPTPNIIDMASIVNTLSNRSVPPITISKGSKITITAG